MIANYASNKFSSFSHSFSQSLSLLDPDIVNGVYWSEALNKVFVDNFRRDPTLIWQYFGSAKGFFRQYPGAWCCIMSAQKLMKIKLADFTNVLILQTIREDIEKMCSINQSLWRTKSHLTSYSIMPNLHKLAICAKQMWLKSWVTEIYHHLISN